MWAWRVLQRLAFQGTFFRLSDTRTQGRGTPKEVRTTLVPGSCSFSCSFHLPNPTFPCLSPPPPTQGQRSVPTRRARALVPLLGPFFQHLCGWKGRIGRSGHTQPHGPAPWLAQRSELVLPEEPSPGRSIRDCGYGPRCGHSMGASVLPPAQPSGPAGAATMGRPPLLRPAPKLRAAPSPALRRLAA